jgi:S-disulfanyl-L-cysteine oxidoreductase SoxD
MVIHSGSRWVFDVPPRLLAVTSAALMGIIASAGRGEPALQAQNGGKLYAEQCAQCHGATLGGGKGPPLRGADFLENWQKKTARKLFSRILTTMPAADPATLPEQAVLDITVYILSQNGADVGSDVKTSPDQLDTIEIDRSRQIPAVP